MIAKISDIAKYDGQEVTIQGWVANLRSSGKIVFLQLRDGSTGILQAVVSEKVSNKQVTYWKTVELLTIESSVVVNGKIRKESRAPGGFEMEVSDLRLVQRSVEFPIGKKEHGPEFLLDNRQLWLRSQRQVAILRVRDTIIWALREFFRKEGFVMTDTPILTPTSCEGTTTLFETEYFGEKAYLSQSGQLYLEALAMALGKVYDFGPTFRAEKSKTRRHLTEFWMLDAEMAFMDLSESITLQERMIVFVVKKVLAENKKELEILERDIKPLEKVAEGGFIRMTYDQALAELKKLGSDIKWGADLGNDDETILTKAYPKPIFVTHYPVEVKAFYMKPDPENPKTALCADLLAPEGYGEVIGGSQRIDDLKLLEQRLKEQKLPKKDFEWYLDLRRYGSVPHSGFGIGLERTVTWICGLKHVRESIPFPRMINRLTP
ncbi:asparagine--tRNA ligase [Candidatus Parcubacteria bacterium]|jgi:asparaginyl-tRNA synthetase|nr:MAG: asparagine--tRNA ligase [Candidatus Parcubacteria bacterium]